MLDIAPKARSRETLVTAQAFGKLRLPGFSFVLTLAHSFNSSRLCQIFI
jgi:hypothetical protein